MIKNLRAQLHLRTTQHRRQTRFKAQHLAGKSDERDICAFARDTDEMRTMLEHVRIDTDNVDWTEP